MAEIKPSKLDFDRWDFLSLRMVLGFVAVGALVVGFLLPILEWLSKAPLEWVSAVSPSTPPALPDIEAKPGAIVRAVDGAALTLTHPTAGQRILAMLPGALLALTVLAVVYVIWRTISGIQSETPFVAQAVRGLRILGLILAGMGIVLPIVRGVVEGALWGAAVEAPDGLLLHLDLPLPLLLVTSGLVAGALAQAFVAGAKLQADVDGLI